VFRWKAAEGWPVEYVSPNVRQFGYTVEDFLSGKVPYAQIVHADDLKRVSDEVKRHSDTTTPSFVQEYRIVLPDGQVRWIYDRTVVVRDAKGSITHFDGYILDVTDSKIAEDENRRLEAQFHHAQKLESLGVLAGGIAHDFNNLLMSMLGHASLAETDVPQGSLAHEHLKQIELAARRASELTNQMLAYSGRGRFVVGPVDLSSLVSEMARLLETVISKAATLKVELGTGLPAIEADATQLRQVVMNLITNASDALEEKPGRITVRTGTVAGAGAPHRMVFGDALSGKRCVFLEVSDTGSGMDEATQKRIFDPFFTTKAAGRGLGLAAVLGIVRGHGGAIRVDSAKGRGTTVEVRFPATSSPLPPKIEGHGPARSRAPGGVVLVVDDEQSVRNVSRAMLERLGYRVVLAESGKEAIEVVRGSGRKLTAAVLDLTMPGEKGDLVFASIRKISPELPILVSSGWHESEAIPRLGTSSQCRFLQKPYATRDLGEALDLLLGGREASSN
jgi:PAS domain S-box-containing protein